MTKQASKPEGDCIPVTCAYGTEIITVQAQMKMILGIVGVSAPFLVAFGAWMVLGLQRVELRITQLSANIAVIADNAERNDHQHFAHTTRRADNIPLINR